MSRWVEKAFRHWRPEYTYKDAVGRPSMRWVVLAANEKYITGYSKHVPVFLGRWTNDSTLDNQRFLERPSTKAEIARGVALMLAEAAGIEP
jgi:hypothetical protein